MSTTKNDPEVDTFLHFLLCELREAVRCEAYPATGICAALSSYSVWLLDGGSAGSLYYRFASLAKKWPKYSGIAEYPVPAPWDQGDPEQAYDSAWIRCQWGRNRFGDGNDAHYWLGEYGQLRIELLDFVIDYLEKELT